MTKKTMAVWRTRTSSFAPTLDPEREPLCNSDSDHLCVFDVSPVLIPQRARGGSSESPGLRDVYERNWSNLSGRVECAHAGTRIAEPRTDSRARTGSTA